MTSSRPMMRPAAGGAVCFLLAAVALDLLAGCAVTDEAATAEDAPADAVLLPAGIEDELVGFAVASDESVWLASEETVYQVRGEALFEILAGQLSPANSAAPLRAFCVSGNAPVQLRGDDLSCFRGGKSVQLVEVPLREVKLAATPDFTYVYGVSDEAGPSIFLVTEGEGHQHLLSLPEPVDAFTVSESRVYYTVGSVVFSFVPGAPLVAEAMLPGLERIVSLAVDPVSDVFYLSDGKGVYALLRREGTLILLSGRGGESVAFSGDTLYVVTRNPSSLYRLPGLSRALATGQIPAVPFE